jgi:hypothetical protein
MESSAQWAGRSARSCRPAERCHQSLEQGGGVEGDLDVRDLEARRLDDVEGHEAEGEESHGDGHDLVSVTLTVDLGLKGVDLGAGGGEAVVECDSEGTGHDGLLASGCAAKTGVLALCRVGSNPDVEICE